MKSVNRGTTMKIPTVLAILALVILGACRGVIEGAEDGVALSEESASDATDELRERPAVRAGGAQVSEGVYIGARKVEADPGQGMPANLLRANAVRLASRDPLTLSQIAERLTALTGVPHIVSLGPAGLVQGSAEAAVLDSTTVTQDPTAAGPAAGRFSAIDPGAGAAGITMTPDLEGPLPRVLEEIATYFDVSWSYAEGRVSLRDYVTRQYQVVLLPDSMESETQIGRRAEGSSSSGSVGSAITASSEVEVDFWDELQDAVESLMGPGASVAIGRGTGVVTVTARVVDHTRIADYVASLNQTMSEQVSLDVNVLTVEITDASAYGIDLDQLLVAIGDVAIDFAGTSPLTSTVGSVNIGILDGDVTLSSVAQALESAGRVSVVNRTGAVTSNNRMVPIQVVDEQSYVRETSINRDSDGDVTDVAITPDVVTTGFTLQMLPRILNNSDVMLNYAIEISALRNLTDFGEGDTRVQLPEVSRTTFQQQAVLTNGETLVLAGFERYADNSQRSGTGVPEFFLLGGGVNASQAKLVTVITITPRIIERRRPILSVVE
jgi:type IVB pilus formation R64 PilN family outer membrane protein